MPRLLITGDQGYIGTHLRAFLPHAEGCDLQSGTDYRSISDQRYDEVIHLAASVSVTESVAKPGEYMDNNAIGVRDFLKHNYVKRLVFVSTGGAMYGDKLLAVESDARYDLCKTPYAQSKFIGEEYVRKHRNHVILRLANVYGGDMDIRGEASALTHFRRDNPITVYGGTQTRDFVHINVVCGVLVNALTKGYGTYNLGSGNETSILEMARGYAMRRGVPLRILPARAGEVTNVTLDNRKALRDLGAPWSEFV